MYSYSLIHSLTSLKLFCPLVPNRMFRSKHDRLDFVLRGQANSLAEQRMPKVIHGSAAHVLIILVGLQGCLWLRLAFLQACVRQMRWYGRFLVLIYSVVSTVSTVTDPLLRNVPEDSTFCH